MNTVSTTNLDFVQENSPGSDSDTNSEELPEYYQPIAAEASPDDADEEFSNESNFQRLPNGYSPHSLENGVTSLDLSDDDDENLEIIEEEEMEEARMREVMRAFREDERRRNAPLSVENSTRVMEAMRGVSFGGTAPDWANRVPENQWIHQLSQLRRSSPPSTTSAALQD